MSDSATPTTPAYVFTPQCRDLIAAIGLTEEALIDAYERRDDAMVVPSVPAHVYSIRWQGDGRAVWASCDLTRMEWHVDRSRPAEVTFTMGLWLSRLLPAGPIGPRMELDRLWTCVAESFGTGVTCHKDVPAHRRYTGRWDGAAPRVSPTGIEGDVTILDGGFEETKTGVKYVWALSRGRYEAWVGAGGEACGTAASSAGAPKLAADGAFGRLAFARMSPAKLRRPVVLRADLGEAAARLVCTRCSLVTIDDPPHFHPPTRCLHVFGGEVLDPDRIPSQLTGKEYIVPLSFVTDIRSGPAVFVSGENMAPRSAILPSEFRPRNKMSVRAIESLLAELTAP